MSEAYIVFRSEYLEKIHTKRTYHLFLWMTGSIVVRKKLTDAINLRSAARKTLTLFEQQFHFIGLFN